MKLIRMGLVAAAATCLLATAVAQSPVGTWKGKMDIKLPDTPQMKDPKMRQMIESSMAMVKKMTINLNLKADKTYTLNVTGMPQAENDPNSKDNGTWSQAGKTVTVKSAKKDKKGGMNEKPQTMTMSADGKTMIMKLPAGPGGPGGSGSIVFTKG